MITINNTLDKVLSYDLDHKKLTLKPGKNAVETVGSEGFNEKFVRNLVKNVPVLEIVENAPVSQLAPIEPSVTVLPNTGEKNYVDQEELRKQLETLNPETLNIYNKVVEARTILMMTENNEKEIENMKETLANTNTPVTNQEPTNKLKELLKTPTKAVAKGKTKTPTKKK